MMEYDSQIAAKRIFSSLNMENYSDEQINKFCALDEKYKGPERACEMYEEVYGERPVVKDPDSCHNCADLEDYWECVEIANRENSNYREALFWYLKRLLQKLKEKRGKEKPAEGR